MTIDRQRAPGLNDIVSLYRPARKPGRRAINLGDSGGVSLRLVATAAAELRLPEVRNGLDAGEIATLAMAAAKARRNDGGDGGMAEALAKILESKGNEIATDVVLAALAHYGKHRILLSCFPDIVGSRAMVAAITEAIADGEMGDLERIVDVEDLVIRDADEARRVLPLARSSAKDFLPTYIVAAMARGMGWTAWVKLFAILFADIELASVAAPVEPPVRDQHERGKSLGMRQEAWRVLRGDSAVRNVALLLVDMGEIITGSGPDLRGVYVDRLRTAIGEDADLRRASIEALIWLAPAHQRELAVYVATRMVRPEDEALLRELSSHPDRATGYAADLVRSAVFGIGQLEGRWPRPSIGGIAEGLFQLRLGEAVAEEARTWIGDRLLERLIEQTVAGEETRFADAYADHSEEGEEGLLRSIFSDLAARFRDLNQGLVATAQATGSVRSAGIELTYRPVDKAEEGKPGVNRDGADVAPTFSADLCLIVDPYLDGISLGKRATLVQAKRLRRREVADPSKGFAASFRLDPKQMEDLMRQTNSSHYLFQCGGIAGRGVPVMPTRLVDDLARHHAPTAAQIPALSVGPASRSLAEWLTYVVLALRTGDPLAELVAKAEGGPGRRPRPLARLGTVEIEVRVGAPPPKG